MLILAVITGIIIWRIVIYCQQDKEEETKPVSMRIKLKQTVIKYKVYIAVGSCVSSVVGGLWIYFMYIHPLLGNDLDFHFEAHWEIGPQESWAAHFEMLTASSEVEPQPCPHFSRENFIHIIETFNNVSSGEFLHDTMANVRVSRDAGLFGMYGDNDSFPVVVLETSSYNYRAVRHFIRHREQVLLQTFPSLKILVYDMGLTFQQKYKLLNCSQCEIVENLPGVRAYYWTPLLIYLSLQRFHSVIWLDPSSDLDDDTLKNILEKTETEEIQIVLKKDLPTKWSESRILKTLTNQQRVSSFDILLKDDGIENLDDSNTQEIPMSQMTLIQDNLSYGSNEACLTLVPSIQSDVISIRRNNFTMEAIVRPWVFCALSGQCIPSEDCRPFYSYDYQIKHHCDQTDHILKRILVSLFNDMFANFYFNK
ncbi:uncharacterized protein LOC125673603 [Ostrea edulis]|uniref:uncharacterized protein LOC125673603 n=1 Tax=Ostrea edulis TaxID=37623 RepID=UPI0024AF35D8|nr:uncharacterized protein LOC125673603 [Ostrea edulis]